MLLRVISFLLTALALGASSLPDYPFVYAIGVAKREVAPDKAEVHFKITVSDRDPARAMEQESELAAQVVQFCRKVGVPSSAIVCESLEKEDAKDDDDHAKLQQTLGYRVSRTMHLDLEDLSVCDKLMEFLYAQPSVREISASFGRKDEAAILDSLTDEACRDAGVKAERMAHGFRKKVKDIKAISEYGFSDLSGRFGFPADSEGYSSAAPNRDLRMIPATIIFQKAVYSIIEIE